MAANHISGILEAAGGVVGNLTGNVTANLNGAAGKG